MSLVKHGGDGVTRVYAVNCVDLGEESTLQQVLGQLDDARRARVQRLRIPQKQAQCAAAGILLRHLFGTETIACEKNGKPFLKNRPDIHFNLSHTGNWVFCAVSHVRIGIDAQMLTTYNKKLAERWFTSQEQQWIDEDPDVRFTRLWTQKEAYAKMTGVGMAQTVTNTVLAHHVIKEYADFADENMYITVCTDKNAEFPPTIHKITEPLW